jgi:uncharacterized membrane protein YfcA
VASGFWFHALPAPVVPPLVALASVAAQLVSFRSVKKSFNWARATPFLAGGAVGIPLGVFALVYASPSTLRFTIGVFLIAYSALQLFGFSKIRISPAINKIHDGLVGAGGGFLGGFAGLSGPLPLIWLQLKGGASEKQRAIYQPFNLVVLTAASIAMIVAGQVTGDVWLVVALCLPATMLGLFIGTRIYKGVSEKLFRSTVLILLLASGLVLIGQTVFD